MNQIPYVVKGEIHATNYGRLKTDGSVAESKWVAKIRITFIPDFGNEYFHAWKDGTSMTYPDTDHSSGVWLESRFNSAEEAVRAAEAFLAEHNIDLNNIARIVTE